jgi:hypothetical protein
MGTCNFHNSQAVWVLWWTHGFQGSNVCRVRLWESRGVQGKTRKTKYLNISYVAPVQEEAIGQQLTDAKKRQAELKQESKAHSKTIRKLDQQKSRQLKCARTCSKEELLVILRGKEAAEAAHAAEATVPDGDVAAAVVGPNGDFAAAAVPEGDRAAEAAVPDVDHVAEAAVPDGDLAVAAVPDGDFAVAAVPDGDFAEAGVPNGDFAEAVPDGDPAEAR